METQWNHIVKTKVTETLTAFFLLCLSVFSHASEAEFNPPYPYGSMLMQLVEAPSPVLLSIHSLPVQDAQVNSTFVLALSPYVGSSLVEMRYQVTNAFTNTQTAYLTAINTSLTGLPQGLLQSTAKPGDCPLQFVLPNSQSCLLHLYVDRNNYVSAEGAYGPVVTMNVSWRWGKNKRRSKNISASVAPIVSQRIDDLLSPLMLPVHITVIPEEQAGLHFDKATSSITGTPNQTGVFSFKISASNGNATAAERELLIRVAIDPKDTPVFKNSYTIASAMPNQDYQLNLMDLLEPTPGFMVTNQVRFNILPNLPHPDWLSLDEKNPALLRGHAPVADAGQEKSITLIATSNTGGDSKPVTIKIPVAFDPAKKPVIQSNITLTGKAGSEFHNDFHLNISDPAEDRNLQVLIEKVEPTASWLKVSTYNPTEISGTVPEDDSGREYQVTLRARTAVGGSSEAVTIPLNIAVNKSLTPRFYQDNPQLPLLYSGQTFSHDFALNRDVFPEYKDVPYVIELAKERSNPSWVRIENNKLVIDMVPDNLEQIERVFITIKNVPGGKSDVLALKLFVMN